MSDTDDELSDLITGPKYVDAPMPDGRIFADLSLEVSPQLKPVKDAPAPKKLVELAVPSETPDAELLDSLQATGDDMPAEAIRRAAEESRPASSLVTRNGSSFVPRYRFRDLSRGLGHLKTFPPKSWADELVEIAQAKKTIMDQIPSQEMAGLVKLLGADLYRVGEAVSVIVAPKRLEEIDQVMEHLKAAPVDAAVFLCLATGQVSMTYQLADRGWVQGRDYEWLPQEALNVHERQVMRYLLKRLKGNVVLFAMRRLR